MGNLLFSDTIGFDFRVDEKKSENGKTVMKGLFQRAEAVNNNGRIYPKSIMEREIKSLQPAIQNRQLLGQISHPDSAEINLEKASHVITELHMDGNDVYGTLEILPTPSGQVLNGLVEAGVKVGISSRGTGTLKETNGKGSLVNDDYKMVTFDIVHEPSTHGAFPEMLREWKEEKGWVPIKKQADLPKETEEKPGGKSKEKPAERMDFRNFFQKELDREGVTGVKDIPADQKGAFFARVEKRWKKDESVVEPWETFLMENGDPPADDALCEQWFANFRKVCVEEKAQEIPTNMSEDKNNKQPIKTKKSARLLRKINRMLDN